MLRSQLILFMGLVLLLAGCHKAGPKDFPEEKPLGIFPATQFVPVMEEKIAKDKNVIYAASFLVAWKELRSKIGQPVISSVPQLNRVEESDSYEDIPEAKKDVKVADEKINITASFEQSLAYAYPMETVRSGLTFKGKTVRAFGYKDGNSAGVKMLYYKNDDEFVLSVQGAEKEEIILAKGFDKGRSLRVMLNNIQVATKIGSKYLMDAADVLIIPVLRFNLAGSYPKMENSFITANNKRYQIEKASQQTAFLLNETGAKVKSKAELSVEAVDSGTVMKPKQLLFDKPFVVLLRKRDAAYPYFMLKVVNTELMMPN